MPPSLHPQMNSEPEERRVVLFWGEEEVSDKTRQEDFDVVVMLT